MRKGFKYRMGLQEELLPQDDWMSRELGIALWNVFQFSFVRPYNEIRNKEEFKDLDKQFRTFFELLYVGLENPIDEFHSTAFLEEIKQIHLFPKYEDVYEFIEIVIEIASSFEMPNKRRYKQNTNEALRMYNSVYQIIDDQVVPISNEEEISEIKTVSQNAVELHIESVTEHLNQALKHLKPNGDLRNSIKESISMVETIAKFIAPGSATLGKAIKKLEKDGKISKLMEEKYTRFYQYTNAEDGIRHALMDQENLSVEDARYFLISCSAFTNYLFEKGRKLNLFENQNPT